MRFFVTFGQKYRHEPHPHSEAHPDAVIEVLANSTADARATVVEHFGQQWSGIYPWDQKEIDLWYPRGVVATIEQKGRFL